MAQGTFSKDKTVAHIHEGFFFFFSSPSPLSQQITSHLDHYKHLQTGVPIVAQQKTNPTSIHKVVGLIPGLAHWVKDWELP